MRFSLLVLALVCKAALFMNAAGFQYVPLNKNSSIYTDIQSIEHHAEHRKFHIQLKPARRCDQPTFLLRLSGAALYKLDAAHETEGRHSYEYPPLVDVGEYFLHAIVLFCQAYDANDMNELCLENPKHGMNVINERYSFVVNDTDRSVAPFPHWRNTAEPSMIPTRYQRLASEPRYRSKCERIIYDIYCFPEGSEVEPYKNYKWVHGVNGLAPVENVFHNYANSQGILITPNKAAPGEPLQTKNVGAAVMTAASDVAYSINVCFVGDSHARELMLNAAEYVNTTRYITFTLVVVVFPTAFTTAVFRRNKCSAAVITFGQWSLSKFAPTPFKLGLFSEQMQSVMSKIAGYQAEDGRTKIFFRTENYNGLSARMTKCPHEDYRTVPAFDAVNERVRELCRTQDIPFIDLHPVIGPMWDAALDYSHPLHHVLRAEVDVILHAVFSHVISRNWVLQTHPISVLQRMHEQGAHMAFSDWTEEQMDMVHGRHG